MTHSLEKFELLSTGSQLRRAAEHAHAFYRGAIPFEECQEVVTGSYDVLAETARVVMHLVPLAERWAIARLRRIAVLDRRFVATAPEVVFVDGDDALAAPIAAALLAGYGRGLVHTSSAGLRPAEGVDDVAIRAMADVDIDLSEAFCKPLTYDAVATAAVIVVIGELAIEGLLSRVPDERIQRWDVEIPDGPPYEKVKRVHNQLERRVVRLLADMLTPSG